MVYLAAMKPKTYWKALIGSVTQPAFYIQILNRPLSFSIRFFVISCVLLGVVSAFLTIQIRFPQFLDDFQAAMVKMEQNYPSDLVIHWSDGKLSTNTDQPLLVTYPESIGYRPTELLSMIDPQFNDDQLDQIGTQLPASTFSVVTQQNVLINDGLGNWTIIRLNELPYFNQDFEITHANLPIVVSQATHQFQQLLQIAKPVTFVLLPVIFLITGLWTAIWYTIIGQFLLTLYGKNFGFKKIYQLTLHLIFVAQCIAQLTLFLYPQVSFSMFSLSYWVLFIALSFTLRQVSAVKLVLPKNKPLG